MIKNRVALISADEMVLRFFVSELTGRGYGCVCGSAVTEKMYGCAFWIADADSVALADTTKPILWISKDFSSALQESEVPMTWRLSFPSSLRELNRFLSLAVGADDTAFGVDIAEPTDDAHSETQNELFYDGSIVFYRGQAVSLSETEKKLLFALGRACGALVPRCEIATLLGDEKGNSVEVYICHLRNKLEKPFAVRLIETVRGKGYRLCASLKPLDTTTNLSFAEGV